MIKERGRDIQRGKNSVLGDVVFGWRASRTSLFGLAQATMEECHLTIDNDVCICVELE